jgi:NAD(P)H-dependent flavin oxidoreductase YrpB (nitropropane dioxygenase family)
LSRAGDRVSDLLRRFRDLGRPGAGPYGLGCRRLRRARRERPAGREIRRRIARVRGLTDRSFGANVIIAELEQPHSWDADRAFVRDQIAAVVDERAPLLVLFWGDPAPFVEQAHRNSLKVFVQVGSVAEAQAAAAAGVDAVIAQGIEAGGHVQVHVKLRLAASHDRQHGDGRQLTVARRQAGRS